MKAIQITVDEPLLKQLDADGETQAHGRSAVIRAALREHLRGRRERRIAEAYRKGYGAAGGLGDDFAGWEEQGIWPEK
jgi:metal-responsive CopG/Arc/MetJ family transcriptional regulator